MSRALDITLGDRKLPFSLLPFLPSTLVLLVTHGKYPQASHHSVALLWPTSPIRDLYGQFCFGT